MHKNILITTGGTGGHVYPALTLAKQLQELHPNTKILFVGGGLQQNKYFERESFAFQEVPCGSFLTKNPLDFIKSSRNILQGIWKSRRIIKTFSPDLVVGFGNFYTFPTLLAAKLCTIPIILHEANRIPGKVNRLLSRYVAVTGVHFQDTAKQLQGNVIEVGMPLRKGYRLGATSQPMARQYFNLEVGASAENRILLVFGGSQGAKAINQLIYDTLPLLPKGIQLLHFTGNTLFTEKIQALCKTLGIRACVKDFETRMDLAWEAADLMISRAGAGTISEQMEFETPGIFIPYPYAANHQEANADFVVDVVGGAIKKREKDLDGIKLAQLLSSLLDQQQNQLITMQTAIQKYKQQSTSIDLCTLVCNFAKLEVI